METLAQQFCRVLKKIGIRYVFGVPSGSMIDYIQAFSETDQIDFILVSHEASAGFMACVCGRLTHIPGACFATFGPGATNLSTGVGCALLDRAPLLAFTDEIPQGKRHRTVQMKIDHQALYKPITKWTTRLAADTVRETIFKAAGIAVSGMPGPVHIGVPSDISHTSGRQGKIRISPLPDVGPADPSALMEMKQAFSKARTPLVVLGLRSIQAGLKGLIQALVEKFSLPVVLTPMAKGMVSEGHPLYAGVLNHALADKVGKTHQQADLIIGIGYDPVEVNYDDWVPFVPIVHIDTVPADSDIKGCAFCIDVTGDIKGSIQSLLSVSQKAHEWNLAAVTRRKQEMFDRLMPGKNTFDILTVLEELRRFLPQDGILTCDVGAHLHVIGQKWLTPEPDCLLMTNGWSSMGFAIPAAIAAKLCCPDRSVACVVGDGGFLMSAGEMATAHRLRLNIVFILLSDQSLSLIRIKQTHKFHESGYGTRLSENDPRMPDVFLGVPMVTVTEKNAYQSALQDAFALTGPIIINAKIDSSAYDDLVLRSNR